MNKLNKNLKTAKQLERHFKGVANHHRINILLLISQRKDICVEDIAKELDCNMKTISEHTKKLTHAGLINKRYLGKEVGHTLSPYGKIFLRFIKSFQSL